MLQRLHLLTNVLLHLAKRLLFPQYFEDYYKRRRNKQLRMKVAFTHVKLAECDLDLYCKHSESAEYSSIL